MYSKFRLINHLPKREDPLPSICSESNYVFFFYVVVLGRKEQYYDTFWVFLNSTNKMRMTW